MIVERILEAALIVLAIGAAMRLVGLRDREDSSLWAQVRPRPVPVTAIVVTAPLVLEALIEIVRPSARAGVWLVAAWAPVGAVAGMVGYRVSEQNVAAYSFGCSGATYFTAGTLCAALLVTGTGRGRLLGLAALAVGVVMWLATNDGHGVMVVEGAVLGLVLAGARYMLRPTVPA